MKWNHVQVLFKDNEFDFTKASVSVSSNKVQIIKTYHFSNTHYIEVDVLVLPNATSGAIQFNFKNSTTAKHRSGSRLPRRAGKGTTYAQGVNAADLS